MIGRDRDVTEGDLSGSGEEGFPEAVRESREASARVPVERSERPIVAMRQRETVAERRGRSLETRDRE
jgi:hypothetical protein